MDAGDATLAGALLGGAGAVLVVAGRQRLALAGGFLLLGAAEILLAVGLLPRDDAGALLDEPVALAGLAVALVVVAGLAAGFLRRPDAVPVALLLAAPFRIPVELGSQRAFLLVPLYVVLAAAAAAFLVRLARGWEPRELPRALALPAALFLALAAVSLLWSGDTRNGSVDLAFFLLPFAALVAIVARGTFPAWLPRALATGLVGLASLFALYGLWQLRSRELPFAPDLEVANAYTSFFRVTSVFHDPSVYGRHLALAIVVLVAALWLGRVGVLLGGALIALLWAGLYFSYSQSSMVALAVGVVAATVFAADRAGRRVVALGALVLALVAASFVVATGRQESLKRLTSGRSDLVENTVAVIRSNPVAGVGLGAEARASREEAERHGGQLAKPSHTTPLTVAAELGAVGIVAYLLFLVGALRLFLATRGRDGSVAVALGSGFLVLFVHSLFYSGFFEDPLMWGMLAVAAAALAAPAPAPQAAPVVARAVRVTPARPTERPSAPA